MAAWVQSRHELLSKLTHAEFDTFNLCGLHAFNRVWMPTKFRMPAELRGSANSISCPSSRGAALGLPG